MEKTLDNQTTTKNALSFDLIKGQFSAEEARDILMHMIQKKIDFHEMKIFSEDIRFGSADTPSMNRVEELRISKSNIKKIVDAAHTQGREVKITSYTKIELI